MTFQPTPKEFKILKIDKKPSKYNRDFYYVFMRSDTDRSFRTCLDPANRNFMNWKNIVKVGNVLGGIRLKLYNGQQIVDADSRQRVIRYEDLPRKDAPQPEIKIEAPQEPVQSALFDIPAAQSKPTRRSEGAH